MKVIAIASTSAGCVRRTSNGRSATPLQPRVPARTPVVSVARSRPGARVVLAASSSSNAEYVEDSSFSIAKVSFGTILAPIGVGLMTYGFGAFFTLLPGGDLSSLLLIYGFPIMLLGFALKYAELEPVPCKTTRQALDLRDTQMTDIQKQVREDCTRFRYGDEQHLEEALQRVFKLGRQSGLPKKSCPRLVGLREEVRDSNYTLVMEFETLPEITEEVWMEFQPKIQSFFGPGIVADVLKTEAGAEVALISDGSGSGRGGPEQKDALPPLMPGLPARQG